MSATSPFRAAVVALAAALASFKAQPASAAPGDTPETFVRRVYALYKTSDNSTGVKRTRPGGSAFYAAPLLDAFAKDDALLHGELGVIDADPLCACQAWENLRVERAAFTKADAATVKAHVVIGNFVGAQRQTVAVTLTLAQTPAGWRIADVGDKHHASIMAALRSEISELARAARAAAVAPAAKKP